MKTLLRYLIVSAALIAIATTFGQQKAEAELRVGRLQQAIEQFSKAPKSIEQVPLEKLLQQIVDEVTFLHRENIALRKEVENLKAKK